MAILTPRGKGGVGGVDRLTDSLRPLLAALRTARVSILATRGPWRWSSPAVTLAALIRLAGLALMGCVDVVHIQLGTGAGFWRKRLFALLCRRLGTPYVLHLHGSAFERFWIEAPPPRRRAIDRAIAGAARILVLGEAWRRLVLGQAPDAAGRVIVLPNAAPPFTAPREPGEGVTRLLFLGEVGARKGVGVLIEALAKLPADAPWRAVVAGEGDGRPYAAAAARLGLQGRIDFPGWAGPEAVRRLLAASDVLVLPSFEENLPLAVIEAFAAGLAVVATPVGAVGDVVIDGETGLLAPPGDVGALAAAMHRMIVDEPLRLRLGAAAKALHGRRLTLTAYVETLMQIWHDAASTREHPLRQAPF